MQNLIEKAWNNKELLQDKEVIEAIQKIILQLNDGSIRVAEPQGNTWIVNEWIKKAILLYFQIQPMKKDRKSVV